MHKICITIAAFILSSTPLSFAQSSDLSSKVAKCAQIQGTLERVECYDNAAKQHNLVVSNITDVSNSGDWVIDTKINPIDDSKTVTLYLRAKSGKSRFGNTISLIARCKSDQTEFYINWQDYLGDDSSSPYNSFKRVTTRIGSEKAATKEWGLSTDSKATFAPGWGGDWIKDIARANEFVAQTTPYNENPVTAIFDVTGLKQAAEPLAETCGWSF